AKKSPQTETPPPPHQAPRPCQIRKRTAYSPRPRRRRTPQAPHRPCPRHPRHRRYPTRHFHGKKIDHRRNRRRLHHHHHHPDRLRRGRRGCRCGSHHYRHTESRQDHPRPCFHRSRRKKQFRRRRRRRRRRHHRHANRRHPRHSSH